MLCGQNLEAWQPAASTMVLPARHSVNWRKGFLAQLASTAPPGQQLLDPYRSCSPVAAGLLPVLDKVR